MNVETLKSIISNPLATPSDRQAALEKLRLLGATRETDVEQGAPSEPDEAADRAEDFLRSVPLDLVARRCLSFSGKPTFLQVRHEVIDQFAETEDPRPSDEQIARLHALTKAASAVNVYFVEPGAQPDMYRLFVLLWMLDPTKDREIALEEARAEYMELATRERACV